MQALYEAAQYHDIYFELDDGGRFGAHKAVLAVSKVEWFVTLLNSSFAEVKTGVVTLHDVDQVVFEIALKYAYGMKPYDGHWSADEESLTPLFEAASYFRCHSLVADVIPFRLTKDSDTSLLFIDCALQFGVEFEYLLNGFMLGIMDILAYFYLYYDKGRADDLIDRTLKFANLHPGSASTHLMIPEMFDSASDARITILLEKLDYWCFTSPHLKDGIGNMKSILRRSAARGLVPNMELIKLLSYELPCVLKKVPLQVGYRIPMADYNPNKKYPGVYSGGYDKNRDEFLTAEQIRDSKLNEHLFHVFYEE